MQVTHHQSEVWPDEDNVGGGAPAAALIDTPRYCPQDGVHSPASPRESGACLSLTLKSTTSAESTESSVVSKESTKSIESTS